MRSLPLQRMVALCNNLQEIDRLIDTEESISYERERAFGPEYSRQAVIDTARNERARCEKMIEDMLRDDLRN